VFQLQILARLASSLPCRLREQVLAFATSLARQHSRLLAMGGGAGRGKFKGKPTGRRHFSTPEEMGTSSGDFYAFCSACGGSGLRDVVIYNCDELSTDLTYFYCGWVYSCWHLDQASKFQEGK
jgi:hypothetical protein